MPSADFNVILEQQSLAYTKNNKKELDNLLVKLQPIFKKIDTLQSELIKIDENNIAEIRRIGKNLVGYNYSLEKISKKIHGLKHNKRVSYDYLRRKEYENGKVLDATGKQSKATDKKIQSEAELFVVNERKVFYEVEGYRKGCESSISYCQTLIKSYEKAFNKESIQ